MKQIINDDRYEGEIYEVEVLQFSSEEQEITITAIRKDKSFDIYCSDNTYITKILKKIKHDKVEVLSVNKNGTITAIRCTLDKKQLSFRNPKEKAKEND